MDIAIVGIGCRFPGGARTPSEFWELLCGGIDAITEVPADRFDIDALFDSDPSKPGKLYTRWGGYLDQIDEFDADFFGISPREARRIDPQQRLLLEVTWEALEDAGQPPDQLAGSSAGVFVGISTNDYGQLQSQPRNASLIDGHTPAGSGLCIAANRISYCLDLHGPSLAVDTACSSSLTATHLACQSLASGECEVAIAAGVNVLLSPEITMGFCKASMLSPEGRCRPFDADAGGYVRSEGAGAVVLKPLQAALDNRDLIYAVIRATAINQTGRTPGIGVPSASAQKALLRRALHDANVASSDVQYVEAHGTGTAAGDPREAEAIGEVYSLGRPDDSFCVMGSVKGNLGHLEAGAGIAGLIKTALALKHRRIPPSINFDRPSPAIPFDKLRLKVPTSLQEWPAPPGRALAGVNSFGFGGANAHAILAESPQTDSHSVEADDATQRILTISARSPAALRHLAGDYAVLLDDRSDIPLRDVCYTAALRRSHLEHRLALVGSSAADLSHRLSAFGSGQDVVDIAIGRYVKGLEPKLAFVFSGMGPQWWGMGRQLLLEEPVFREMIEECDELLRQSADWSLVEELRKDDTTSRISDADRAHVANFALQVALSALWRSWGIIPDAVVGHSSGEMAAVCVAGGLPLRDAIRLAYHRGRLQHLAAGSGRMLAARISLEAATDLIRGREHSVSIAAINGPASVTISGDGQSLTEIGEELDQAGGFWRWLPVNVPYHGPQMDSLREELLKTISDLDCQPVKIPVVSTATGTWSQGRPFDAGYWWDNIRQPVLFQPAIGLLAHDGYQLFVEVSPHPVLAQSIRECAAQHDTNPAVVLPSLRRNQDERQTLLRSVAALHVNGLRINWRSVLGADGTHVQLPTYPWQRERHWFSPSQNRGQSPFQAASVYSGHPLLGHRLHAARPTWETDLADDHLAYLEDHVLSGSATFPGAAYVEMMLAAAGAIKGEKQEPVAIEEVQFHRLLPLRNRAERLLQCVVEGQGTTVEIHSTTKDGDQESWSLHATARLGQMRPNRRGAARTVQALRNDCPTSVDLDGFYLSVANWEMQYKGAFRGITELWQGRGEALGRIALPTTADVSTDGYVVHPALLDSAFQVFIAAITSGGAQSLQGKGPLVLAGIERVVTHGPVGASLWCHATLERIDGDLVEAFVNLIDDEGNLVLTCEHLKFQAINERASDTEDLMFQEVWGLSPRQRESDPQIDAPSLIDIAEVVRPQIDQLVVDTGFADHYSVIEPTLNAMTVRSVRTALSQLGWSENDEPQPPDRFGVRPQHHQLFARLIEIAKTANTDPPVDEDSSARRDDVAAALQLVRMSGDRLVATLLGEEDARSWLVVGEASDALADFYARNPFCMFYNRVVAELVAATTRQLGRKLRILEVGAGTGATTAAIFEHVPEAVAVYVFTDISPFFATRAKDRFQRVQNIRFEVLDIEREPALNEPRFDIVVAANVVHATADITTTLLHLRSLLQPGGLLFLLECTRPEPWLDLVFGQFDGWWRFTDHDVRPTHPLIDVSKWEELFEAAGFGEYAYFADTLNEDGEPAQGVFVAQAPTEASPLADITLPQSRWLILADERGVGTKVAADLRARGDRCTLVRPRQRFRRSGDGRFALVPTKVDHWRRLLHELGEHEESPLNLIHLWSLDAPSSDDMTASTLMDFQQVNCGSIITLMQATNGGRGIGDAWLVTAGAQAIEPDGRAVSPAQGPLWGLGRVLRNERGRDRCRLIDLSTVKSTDELDALVAEIVSKSENYEPEMALRGSTRYVRRMRRATPRPDTLSPQNERREPKKESFRLETGSPGALDSLVLRSFERHQPRAGEVTIKVRAAGLNFRDVLQALGMMGPTPHQEPLGLECSGIVTACQGTDKFRPGDEVIALAMGTLASEVTTSADVVCHKPSLLSFEEAATTPVAFVTASYTLRELARVSARDRVLIHSASGGVGLAAVQICRNAGATIFATAGTPEKRAYLASIGIEHVMDSRSLAFADEVLEKTGGEGVDIVLNSLAGEARARGLSLLRPGGRFIEMAVRDILSDMPLHLRPFEKGLSFFALGEVAPARRPASGDTLRTVVRELATGTLSPLPHTDFDLGNAEKAFRLMAQAGHIGKIVLTVKEPTYAVQQHDEPVVRSDATYLLTGGLGGFSLAVADWLVRSGARHMVLMSRSGTPREEDAAAFEKLLNSNAEIVVLRGDVADAPQVKRVLRTIRADMPPLKGIIHAAMTLDDDLLGRLDMNRFSAVLAPKVAGGWNLHQLTREDNLDFFVLFSSGSSLIGVPSQGNYAAANAFLDALAHHRRVAGLPGLTVNWGAIRGVGYVARHPELSGRLTWEGIESISADEACAALEEALRSDLDRVAIARMDWNRWSNGDDRTHAIRVQPGSPRIAGDGNQHGESVGPQAELRRVAPDERRELLGESVIQCTAKVLETDAARVDPAKSLTNMGLDSLMAVELQSVLRRALGVEPTLVELLGDDPLISIIDGLVEQVS